MEGKYTEANDTWAGGVKVSEKDKVNLKMKGIEFHKEVRIPDSDDDSEEEGEVEDEEDSDEDSVISPSLNDSSEEESSGEESSEDEAEGWIEENAADEVGDQNSTFSKLSTQPQAGILPFC